MQVEIKKKYILYALQHILMGLFFAYKYYHADSNNLGKNTLQRCLLIQPTKAAYPQLEVGTRNHILLKKTASEDCSSPAYTNRPLLAESYRRQNSQPIRKEK